MRGNLLLSLALLIILVSSASAIEINGNGKGYFVAEARNAAGFQAEAWAYSEGDGHIEAEPFAQADTNHAEASVQGFATTNNGHIESGTLSTNDLHQSGIGAITNASISGSGTIGMNYLGSVDINNSYQSASASSANVNAYVNTNLSLDEGKASVDSMAKDASDNHAREAVLANNSAWIRTIQTVSIDPTSTSATMDIFGTSKDSPKAMDDLDPIPILSAYSGSGNTLGTTAIQYTISKGNLYTDGAILDTSKGDSHLANPMKAYADNQQSIANPGISGKINFAQDDAAIISANATSKNQGSLNWMFTFVKGEGNITGTATQNAQGISALIY